MSRALDQTLIHNERVYAIAIIHNNIHCKYFDLETHIWSTIEDLPVPHCTALRDRLQLAAKEKLLDETKLRYYAITNTICETCKPFRVCSTSWRI